jgi:hypothetical protein
MKPDWLEIYTTGIIDEIIYTRNSLGQSVTPARLGEANHRLRYKA